MNTLTPYHSCHKISKKKILPVNVFKTMLEKWQTVYTDNSPRSSAFDLGLHYLSGISVNTVQFSFAYFIHDICSSMIYFGVMCQIMRASRGIIITLREINTL